MRYGRLDDAGVTFRRVAGAGDGGPAPWPGRRGGEAHVRRFGPLLLAALLAVGLSACAAGPNPEVASAGGDGVIAGFWLGLWHGVIAPITLVVSLFTADVSIYEVHNSGGWYDVGFFLGFGVLLGGGASGSRRR
jgi:hypothetical protein